VRVEASHGVATLLAVQMQFQEAIKTGKRRQIHAGVAAQNLLGGKLLLDQVIELAAADFARVGAI
jgi:hypothetical protein